MDVQQWLALLITGVATMYLARRSWQSLRGRGGGCGGCQGCDSETPDPAGARRQMLVSLQTDSRQSS